MSQLVKAVVAIDTGDRKILTKGLSPLFKDVFSGKAEWGDNGIGKVYSIGVKLGTSTVIADDLRYKTPEHPLEEAMNRAKKQIVEAVFGEFRQDFRRIEKAIYDYDMETAGVLLHEMERKMFSTEVIE